MKAKDELAEARKLIAQYAGCISRWCGLTGNAVDATKHASKQAEELAAFRKHLDESTAKTSEWRF